MADIDMKGVWDSIVEARAELGRFLDPPPPIPKFKPPATAADIVRLERYFGFSLPDSYKKCLLWSNGVQNFVHRAPLLSVDEIIAHNGQGWEVVEDLLPHLTRYVFVGGPDSDDFFCFDAGTSAGPELEIARVDVNGGETRYPGFGAFLTQYAAALQKAVANEHADRANLRP
jgi:hypothetical protein